MLDGINKCYTYIIVNEMTTQRYKGKDEFGRAFRKACRRAGLERSLTFHDLRTTALTNLGTKRGDHGRDRFIQRTQAKFSCLGDICEARAGSGNKSVK